MDTRLDDFRRSRRDQVGLAPDFDTALVGTVRELDYHGVLCHTGHR